jgi:SAM-dependent methyltransferase
MIPSDKTREYPPSLAEFYDAIPLYRDRRDIEFYVALARESGGPVLELGCGTGRVLLPTARAGIEIVGLDCSAAMLERCRVKLRAERDDVRQRVHLLRGDMAAFALGRRFALITTPFRSFQHLLRVDEQLACLAAARRQLAPGGRLVLEVFHPRPAALHDPAWTEEREDVPETRLEDGRTFRRAVRIAAFHRAEQVNDVEMVFYITHPDGRSERVAERFPMRYCFRFELEHLLTRAGFQVESLFGGFDRVPFADDSHDIIFIARSAAR